MTYYEQNKDRILKKQKEYREQNKDRIKDYNKKYYEKNIKYDVIKKYLQQNFVGGIENIIKENNDREFLYKNGTLEYNKNKRLLEKYKITRKCYYKILKLNNNKCFCCDNINPKEYQMFHVDFRNNKIYGLLCWKCKHLLNKLLDKHK